MNTLFNLTWDRGEDFDGRDRCCYRCCCCGRPGATAAAAVAAAAAAASAVASAGPSSELASASEWKWKHYFRSLHSLSLSLSHHYHFTIPLTACAYSLALYTSKVFGQFNRNFTNSCLALFSSIWLFSKIPMQLFWFFSVSVFSPVSFLFCLTWEMEKKVVHWPGGDVLVAADGGPAPAASLLRRRAP